MTDKVKELQDTFFAGYKNKHDFSEYYKLLETTERRDFIKFMDTYEDYVEVNHAPGAVDEFYYTVYSTTTMFGNAIPDHLMKIYDGYAHGYSTPEEIRAARENFLALSPTDNRILNMYSATKDLLKPINQRHFDRHRMINAQYEKNKKSKDTSLKVIESSQEIAGTLGVPAD